MIVLKYKWLKNAVFRSADGKDWHNLGTRPYDHTVEYDDGTVHTYTTLERPNLCGTGLVLRTHSSATLLSI